MATGPENRTGQAAPVPLILLGMGNVHRELLGILGRKAGGLADRHGVTFSIVACADRSGFVLGPDAQHAPDRRKLENPQKVGVALYVLAGIENQPMPVEQVAHVAKADEGVVGNEPGHARQPSQQA